MTLQLSDDELKQLVRDHVCNIITVDESRLKVVFTRRQNITDTSIEILPAGSSRTTVDDFPIATAEDLKAFADSHIDTNIEVASNISSILK